MDGSLILLATVAVFLAILLLRKSANMSPQLELITILIRESFPAKWFTLERIAKNVLYGTDPYSVQVALDKLVDSGEVQLFVNNRNGHELYRFA